MRPSSTPGTFVRGGEAMRFVLGAALAGILLLGPAREAAAQATQYNSLTLTWTAPGDDGNVGRASAYDLRYRTTNIVGTDTTSWWNGATQATGEPAPSTAGAADSMRVTGLAQGTTYYFIIRAADEVANWSGYSNVAVGTTLSCNPPTSTPGSFAAVADTGQVSVSWNSTSDPNAVSLNLYRAQGASGAWALLRNLSLSTTSYVDQSVAAGTTYRYRAAWMGALCEGPVSSTTTVTTPGTPPPPVATGPEGSSIHAYPNPSNGPIQLVIHVTASTAQSVDVRLYDMNGHCVAVLAEGSYPPGQTQVTWPRVSREGRPVAPGYYEALGTVGSAKVRERLVLLP